MDHHYPITPLPYYPVTPLLPHYLTTHYPIKLPLVLPYLTLTHLIHSLGQPTWLTYLFNPLDLSDLLLTSSLPSRLLKPHLLKPYLSFYRPGDCFEITKQRKNFPEIVPFRLTRMMVAGMGHMGIAGPYRLTCERVMRVLRDNRESLVAMLEAFVYDPLISWLFLTHKTNNTLAEVPPVPLARGDSAGRGCEMPSHIYALTYTPLIHT